MNHCGKEEKYLSVDTSKEIDVFYPDLNDGKIQWVHYDTTQSLVEICVFNKETIRAVNAACWDATEAFQMIREVSNRFLLRPGMDGYEDTIIRMRSDKPAAIGCSYLTLDRLEQFLEAGELLNSYCMREFGCKANFSDLRKVDLGHKTLERGHTLRVYANLEDCHIGVYLDGKILGMRQFDSLREMNYTVLSELSFNDLTQLPEWAVAQHTDMKKQVNPVARIDYLDFRGKVVEHTEYMDETAFLTDLKNQLDCGVSLCVVLYRDQNGKTISRAFLNDLDTLPKGLFVEDSSCRKPQTVSPKRKEHEPAR